MEVKLALARVLNSNEMTNQGQSHTSKRNDWPGQIFFFAMKGQFIALQKPHISL